MQLCLESKDGVSTSPKPQKASGLEIGLQMFKYNIKRLFVMEIYHYLYE